MHLSAIWKMALQYVRVQYKLSLRCSFLSLRAAISKESFSSCSFPSPAFEGFCVLNLLLIFSFQDPLFSIPSLSFQAPILDSFFHDLDFSFFSFSCCLVVIVLFLC